MNHTLHVFTGPTLRPEEVHALAPDAVIHPPVRHGDLFRLAPEPGDRVLIIDGLWHQVPPVRHKEILELLDRGTQVIGAASMGALRAAELAPYGMVGIGWVYEQYFTGHIDADDEVALIHTPDGAPLSTALVCIRRALEAADTTVISRAEAEELLRLARAMPFQRRSWAALGHATTGTGLAKPYQRLAAWLATDRPEAVRDVKAADARLALRVAGQDDLPRPSTDSRWRQMPWRTSHLRRWAATYTPVASVDEVHVPFLPALQHAQLYDPFFPTRWRTRVLAWIASLSTTTSAAVLEERALHAAEERGLRFDHLAPDQIEYWAAPSEITSLCQQELMLRILVRSARLDPTATLWPENPAEAEGLLNLADATQAAAIAWRTNQAIAATGASRTTSHIDPERIRRHLSEHWQLSPTADPRELTAAARDRGILSAEMAIAQARLFYLAARASTIA